MIKKIAVVTTDGVLADFYRFEFCYRGFDVDVFSDLGRISGRYMICIVDIDTVEFFSKSVCGITVELSSSAETRFSYPDISLTWPTPIADIDRLCDIAFFGEKFPSATSVNDGDTLMVADIKNKTVTLGGRTVKLTQSELDILTELCRAGGETVRRERIMELLGATQGNISDVYIHRLRKKLESFGNKRFIFSERGIGYSTALKFKT